MKNVYLVMGNNEYEPGSPVRVFADLARAQKFIAKWQAHQRKRPNLLDYPTKVGCHCNPNYDAYDKAVEAWAKRSPAGADHTEYYSLTVHKMRVYA